MILYLNCVKNNGKTWTKADYLMEAAKRLGVSVEMYNGELQDYILNVEPFGKFVQGKLWTGLWEIDVLLNRAEMDGSNWASSNNVFLAGIHYPERLGEWGNTSLLFQACDPNIHRRIPGIKQEYDFVMCGSAGTDVYSERTRIHKLLASKYSYFDWGKDYTIQEYVQNINTAKVQFIRSMKTDVAVGNLAQRFWECLPVGPVLTQWCEDIEHTGLVEGVDFFSYKNDKEMIMKMNILLSSEELRNQMHQNALKKVLNYHTYEARLATILNYARNNSNKI